MKSYDEIKDFLKDNNAEYLLRFYDESNNKEEMLSQLTSINFDLMKTLYSSKDDDVNDYKKIELMPYIREDELSDEEKLEYIKIGEELIKNGKVAACQMAGGQGTRLGHVGPKGTFMVELNPPKSIFEIFSDKLKETYEKYGTKIKWYLMTSNDNDSDTKRFFELNNYFGYGKENIKFFTQRELPLLDLNGDMIFNENKKLFTGANGNGGIYEALHSNNILRELKENGVTYLGVGNVDNILLDMIDPLLIGMMASKKQELAVKTVTKTSPDERVGVICKLNGNPGVVEYTEITEEMANRRDEKGNLVFGEAYYGLVMYKTDLLERIANDLEYHVAKKKNSYINKNGEKIEATEPNTYKFEMFIFEGFNYAKDMLALSVEREDNFAPIKNKEGADSPMTAIELYNNYKNKNK